MFKDYYYTKFPKVITDVVLGSRFATNEIFHRFPSLQLMAIDFLWFGWSWHEIIDKEYQRCRK